MSIAEDFVPEGLEPEQECFVIESDDDEEILLDIPRKNSRSSRLCKRLSKIFARRKAHKRNKVVIIREDF